MDSITTQQEEKNKRKGMITSIIVHILLILLALWPLLTFPDPPPGQEGILVNLGLPDIGDGMDNAGPAEPVVEEDLPDEPEPEVEEVVKETPKPQPEVVKETPKPQKEVVKTEDPNEVALRRQREKEQEAERIKQQEEARKRAEDEARRKAAEEEARRQAEAEAKKKAEADALKNQIGGLFGDGDGKGNTGKPGNQGDPGGDPDASRLEGISTGSGMVGGGLGDRGVARAHTPTDNSQKEGTVVIRVCVDKAGNVTEAEFTQRGSTTSDSQLKSIAVSSAKQWKFQSGDIDKQCGTITYRFKVR